MNHQPELLQPEHLSPRLRWEKLFQFLPPWPEAVTPQPGRKPWSRSALLKAAAPSELARRAQNTFLAEAAPHYAAKADPTSFTENYVPIVFDWYSGVDAPNPMHPDLHIHLLTVFFRDFNLHPERHKDTDPNKGSWLNDFVAMVDAKAPKAFDTFLIECVKPAPTKGRIGLNSADPTEPPLIDMQLFAADADVTRVAKGIELVRKIMSHPTIQQYGPEEVLPGSSYKTPDQIKEYLRKYSSFGHHMSGTAKMGKPTDPMAVVDSHLKVIGIEGLRLCDTSVFPEIPAYNTSRPAHLVGEVLADLMTKS